MYRNSGKSKDKPRGYNPEPITFTVLSTNDVSYPLKGIYMYVPNMTYFFCSSRYGLVTFSIKDIIPYVVMM